MISPLPYCCTKTFSPFECDRPYRFLRVDGLDRLPSALSCISSWRIRREIGPRNSCAVFPERRDWYEHFKSEEDQIRSCEKISTNTTSRWSCAQHIVGRTRRWPTGTYINNCRKKGPSALQLHDESPPFSGNRYSYSLPN